MAAAVPERPGVRVSWASTAPAAKAALATLTATALPGVVIRIGPVVSDDPGLEAVAIGHQNNDLPTFDGGFAYEGMAATPSREQYQINNEITVRNGDADADAAEVRAFELLAAIGGVLAANPHLGVAGVMSAQLGEYQMPETQTAQGATATLQFAVVIDAFTTT